MRVQWRQAATLPSTACSASGLQPRLVPHQLRAREQQPTGRASRSQGPSSLRPAPPSELHFRMAVTHVPFQRRLADSATAAHAALHDLVDGFDLWLQQLLAHLGSAMEDSAQALARFFSGMTSGQGAEQQGQELPTAQQQQQQQGRPEAVAAAGRRADVAYAGAAPGQPAPVAQQASPVAVLDLSAQPQHAPRSAAVVLQVQAAAPAGLSQAPPLNARALGTPQNALLLLVLLCAVAAPSWWRRREEARQRGRALQELVDMNAQSLGAQKQRFKKALLFQHDGTDAAVDSPQGLVAEAAAAAAAFFSAPRGAARNSDPMRREWEQFMQASQVTEVPMWSAGGQDANPRVSKERMAEMDGKKRALRAARKAGGGGLSLLSAASAAAAAAAAPPAAAGGKAAVTHQELYAEGSSGDDMASMRSRAAARRAKRRTLGLDDGFSEDAIAEVEHNYKGGVGPVARRSGGRGAAAAAPAPRSAPDSRHTPGAGRAAGREVSRAGRRWRDEEPAGPECPSPTDEDGLGAGHVERGRVPPTHSRPAAARPQPAGGGAPARPVLGRDRHAPSDVAEGSSGGGAELGGSAERQPSPPRQRADSGGEGGRQSTLAARFQAGRVPRAGGASAGDGTGPRLHEVSAGGSSSSAGRIAADPLPSATVPHAASPALSWDAQDGGDGEWASPLPAVGGSSAAAAAAAAEAVPSWRRSLVRPLAGSPLGSALPADLPPWQSAAGGDWQEAGSGGWSSGAHPSSSSSSGVSEPHHHHPQQQQEAPVDAGGEQESALEEALRRDASHVVAHIRSSSARTHAQAPPGPSGMLWEDGHGGSVDEGGAAPLPAGAAAGAARTPPVGAGGARASQPGPGTTLPGALVRLMRRPAPGQNATLAVEE